MCEQLQPRPLLQQERYPEIVHPLVVEDFDMEDMSSSFQESPKVDLHLLNATERLKHFWQVKA